MIVVYLPLLICLLGLILYFVSDPSKPKWMEVGRLMFAIGLFVFLFLFGSGRALLVH
jgi:Na+/phosphate symporter